MDPKRLTNSIGSSGGRVTIRDVGQAEPKPCPFCEYVRQPVMLSESSYGRFWSLEEHECPAMLADQAAKREAFIAEVLARKDDPTETEIETVRRAVNLPRRCVPGLVRLQRTSENEQAIGKAEQLADMFRMRGKVRGLYLFGALGTGKTSILGALAFDLRNRAGRYELRGEVLIDWGYPPAVQFWPVPDWFNAINRAMDDDGEARGIVRAVESCTILCLDDIGKQYDTKHKIAELFRVLNHRYNEMLLTCFTSNYSPEDLAKKMVQAVGADYASDVAAMVDRIRETCDVVEVRGKSWRRRGGEQ